MPPASNAEWWTVGIASWVKNARSTCRITSVAITRLTPRRAASMVAIVDLPTPDRSFAGISVQLDEGVVDADRPVADEDDARALGAGAHRDGVDGGGLQLGEVDVAALGGGAVELGGQPGAASEVRGHQHRVGYAGHARRAGGE